METGPFDIVFLIFFLISVYITGFIVCGIYRVYRKIKHNEVIKVADVFLEPLMGISEVLGYIIATVLVFYATIFK